MKTYKLLLVFIVCLCVVPFSGNAQVASNTSVEVSDRYFSGGQNVTVNKFGGLSDVLQKVAAYQAYGRLQNATTVLTNSTGSTFYPSYKLAAMSGSLTAYTETGTTSVTKTAFDTWVGQINTSLAVLGKAITAHNRYAGLHPVGNTTLADRTSTATVTAIATSFTAAASSLVSAATVNTDILPVIRNDVKTLAEAANRLGKAWGQTAAIDTSLIGGFVNLWTGNTAGQLYYETVIISGPSVAGTASDQTLSKVDMDAYAVILGKNVATITTYLNDIFFFEMDAVAAMTDNSGGTGATTVPVFGSVPAYTTAGTDLVGYVEFNDGITVLQTGISSLGLKLNQYTIKNDNTIVRDLTGATPSATIAAVTTALTAIAGSGSVALKYAESNSILGTMEGDLVNLVKQVNKLSDVYGIARLTDNTAVSPKLGLTLSVAGTATTGGTGATLTGVSRTAVNAWFVTARNAVASVADQIARIRTASLYLNVPLNLTAK